VDQTAKPRDLRSTIVLERRCRTSTRPSPNACVAGDVWPVLSSWFSTDLNSHRAIAFGASETTFALPDVVINTLAIDPDVFLMFLGVFNKLLDYLVDDALGHISDTKITMWMLQDPKQYPTAGVSAGDFSLKKELTLPWHSLSRISKHVFSGSSSRAIVRQLLTLVSSICFVLLGAGVNTIGIPKCRWFPRDDNSIACNVTTSRRALEGVNWMTFEDQAIAIIGGGPTTWSVASALSSSALFPALGQLVSLYAESSQPGWQPAWPSVNTYTMIDTRMNCTTCTVHSGSVLGGASLPDIYAELQDSGSTKARESTGILGTANMTVPSLATTCVESQQSALDLQVEVSTAGQITVVVPSTNLSSVECTLVYRQMLFPVEFWQGGGNGQNDGQYHIGAMNVPSTTMLGKTLADESVVQGLQTQIIGMKADLDSLSPTGSFAEYMVMVANNLQTVNTALTSSTAAMSAVIGFTFQHILTLGEWNVTRTDQQVANHFRFAVYGSGPRLAWEWVAVLILIVPTLACCYDVFLIVGRRLTIGPWLQLPGMMLAANASTEFSNPVSNCSGVVRSEATNFFVRDRGSGRMEITDHPTKSSAIQRGQAYGN
jgi:hypothetical protein